MDRKMMGFKMYPGREVPSGPVDGRCGFSSNFTQQLRVQVGDFPTAEIRSGKYPTGCGRVKETKVSILIHCEGVNFQMWVKWKVNFIIIPRNRQEMLRFLRPQIEMHPPL